jgi:hypothetical protein
VEFNWHAEPLALSESPLPDGSNFLPQPVDFDLSRDGS